MNLKNTPLALLTGVTLALGSAVLCADTQTDTPPPAKDARESVFPAIDPQDSVADLKDQLEEVGPTKDQRLAATKVDEDALKIMRKTAKTWNTHNLGTNSEAIRAKARKALVKTRGLKVLPLLLECFEGDAYWQKRESLLACVQLVDRFGDDARWLLYHHEVPTHLISMIGTGPEALRVGLREHVEDALEEIVGRDPLLKHDLSGRTWWSAEQNGEREAFVKGVWSRNWARIHERWTKVQHQREAYRARLEAAIAAAQATRPE